MITALLLMALIWGKDPKTHEVYLISKPFWELDRRIQWKQCLCLAGTLMTIEELVSRLRDTGDFSLLDILDREIKTCYCILGTGNIPIEHKEDSG